jgi:hypothetical protein
MDQNLMALLTQVLSGQGQPLSGQQRQASMQMPAQQPMRQPQQMPAQQQPVVGQGYRAPTMLPMAGEQPDHGPFDDPNDGGNGGGDKDKDGNGGKGKGPNLSWFERKMREIGRKGPTAYPKYIEKNLGMNKPTVGYGKTDPSTFKTGMASSLASVLTGTPEPDPNQPIKMN